MAAARQKEMKLSNTVVATKTLTAGRRVFSSAVDIGIGEPLWHYEFSTSLWE
jgi:hypothetical protein